MCAVSTIRELCTEAARRHEAGDLPGADFLLRQAYALSQGLQSPVLEAKILNTMGAFRIEGKRAKTAVPLLAEAREKVLARIGRNNKLYTIITGNLLQAEVAAIMENVPSTTA